MKNTGKIALKSPLHSGKLKGSPASATTPASPSLAGTTVLLHPTKTATDNHSAFTINGMTMLDTGVTVPLSLKTVTSPTPSVTLVHVHVRTTTKAL